MRKPRRLLNLFMVAAALTLGAGAGVCAQAPRVAVLDFGDEGRTASRQLFITLLSDKGLILVDRDEARTAARGAGYSGSLNMTLQEAKDLGGAIGCDFYFTGDARTLRRSPSNAAPYYEAYASVFIVSALTGRLIFWDRPSVEAPTPAEAEMGLLRELSRRAPGYADSVRAEREAERFERTRKVAAVSSEAPVIEDAPQDEEAASRDRIRLPQPYRRLRPAYPEAASRAEAEATVDVEVEIDALGEVAHASVVRWAGFGLDDSTLETVRQLHFTPARRDGVPVPMRVLLRYNFRKPPKEVKR